MIVRQNYVDPIPLLETERLILRAFRPDDAPEVQRLAGDRLVADTTLNVPHPYMDGMADEWISRHQPAFAQGKGVTFAITNKADGSLIGAISLMGISPDHQAELGYWVGSQYWNRGFCTEAGEAILDLAFTKLNLVRVHSHHFRRNPASGRVMLKLGMQHEGSRRQHIMKWGKLEDDELYGILLTDWKKSANKSAQHNAGDRPDSGDSPTSATPSAPAPRG